jgi:hypothetical protein
VLTRYELRHRKSRKTFSVMTRVKNDFYASMRNSPPKDALLDDGAVRGISRA